MRTNIEIDDKLLAQARKLTGLPTKRATVHQALRQLVDSEARKGMLRYYGSGVWRGDLKRMRKDRS